MSNRRMSRAKAMKFFRELKSGCAIGFEACVSAHHWERELQRLERTVREMPAQYVKLFVKTNKNDYAEAEAVYDAMCRYSMRFVAVKSKAQQSVLLMHRTRALLMKQRTQLINAIRGHCAEFGAVVPKGGWKVKLLAVIAKKTMIDCRFWSMRPWCCWSISCRCWTATWKRWNDRICNVSWRTSPVSVWRKFPASAC